MMGVGMTFQFADDTIGAGLGRFKRVLIKSDANFSQVSPGGLLLAIEVAASSSPVTRE